MSTVLVGNGPCLLDDPMGDIIDQFQRVVRFNAYKLPYDLQCFTGTKTDVWAVNEGLVDNQQRPGCPRPKNTLLLVPWWKRPEGCIWSRLSEWDGLWKDGVELIDERAAREATFWFEGSDYWASTGLLAILHYLTEVPRVSIIGFDHFKGPLHHYADDHVPFCGHHSPEIEFQVIQMLVNTGSVTRL